MKKLSLFYLLPIAILSFSCANNKKTYTIKEAIAEKYYEIRKKYHDEYKKRHPDSSSEPIKKEHCYPTRYIGHKDNMYVVTFHRPNFREFNINIDNEYRSETCYFAPGGPWVFKEWELIHFNDAFCDGLIDLDFVKTFDSFQQEHTVDELDEVYIEL